ncbi:MAG: hypothetical protein PHV32_00615 [Eubacteriales bacterium]|nr:hypothetical protein [Eubacteriales bacterium]
MLNKKGISYVKTAVWVLIICMILSLVLTYASLMTLIQTAESNTQRVLDGFVTHNSKLIYESLKNGSDFTESLNKSFYVSTVSDELSMDFSGNMLYYINEQGVVIYRIANPNVAYEWEDTLKLRATYDILLPVTFAGQTVAILRIPQKVVSYYNLK